MEQHEIKRELEGRKAGQFIAIIMATNPKLSKKQTSFIDESSTAKSVMKRIKKYQRAIVRLTIPENYEKLTAKHIDDEKYTQKRESFYGEEIFPNIHPLKSDSEKLYFRYYNVKTLESEFFLDGTPMDSKLLKRIKELSKPVTTTRDNGEKVILDYGQYPQFVHIENIVKIGNCDSLENAQELVNSWPIL